VEVQESITAVEVTTTERPTSRRARRSLTKSQAKPSALPEKAPDVSSPSVSKQTPISRSIPSSFSPLSRREKLFRKSRPLIRQYEGKDNGVLWAAYQNGSLDLRDGLTQEEFIPAVAKRFGHFPLVWVVEDETKAFKAGRGQVAIIGIKTDGWVFEPVVHFFKWATKRNILRSAVAFFQMVRHQKDVGCCLVRTIKKDFHFMKHMEKYGVLYLRGRVPNGSPRGDVFVFSIDGKKQ
jgi:hypothetical protein